MMRFLEKQIAFVAFGIALVFPSAGWAIDVFVTVPPQKWVVENILGNGGTVNVLVKNGQDPHTFEPTPKQIMALSRAKIWFTMNMPFENRLRNKVGQVAPDLRIVDMIGDIEKHSIHDAHGHDDHDHEAKDPHAWLSPVNLQVMAATTAAVLREEDAGNMQQYNQNLQAVQKSLTELHARIGQQLAPYAGSSFYVFHPSFGYFAEEYGLQQKAVEAGGKSPGPRQIAALVAKAREDRVKVIFVQPQFDQKSGETIARAIDGEVVSLDALAEDVPANLTVMADSIEQALSRRGTK